MTGITEAQAYRAIVGKLELELRTAHAFLGIIINSQGGSIEVAKEHFDELPDDFEVSVFRDEDKVTFKLLSGDEAEEFRKANPVVVNANS